ncbi:MAG: hypothetical protein AAF773_17890, partial [Cyanobacteria bacterium P01_D01_bin.115]
MPGVTRETEISHFQLAQIIGLGGTNLERVERLTQDQLAKAQLCRTQLPDRITLDPNRDCE